MTGPWIRVSHKLVRKAMESTFSCLVKEPTRVSTLSLINIESSRDEETTRVVEGDMGALFTAGPTITNPKLLFAKVVSIKASTEKNLLNKMVETTVGSHWEEKLKTLVGDLIQSHLSANLSNFDNFC